MDDIIQRFSEFIFLNTENEVVSLNYNIERLPQYSTLFQFAEKPKVKISQDAHNNLKEVFNEYKVDLIYFDDIAFLLKAAQKICIDYKNKKKEFDSVVKQAKLIKEFISNKNNGDIELDKVTIQFYVKDGNFMKMRSLKVTHQPWLDNIVHSITIPGEFETVFANKEQFKKLLETYKTSHAVIKQIHALHLYNYLKNNGIHKDKSKKGLKMKNDSEGKSKIDDDLVNFISKSFYVFGIIPEWNNHKVKSQFHNYLRYKERVKKLNHKKT